MMSKSNRLRAATATPKYVAFIVNLSNHLSAPPYLYKNLSTQLISNTGHSPIDKDHLPAHLLYSIKAGSDVIAVFVLFINIKIYHS